MEESLDPNHALDRKTREVSSEGYFVLVGLLDCELLEVNGRDPRLEHALELQDDWSAREHANYWTGLLPQLVTGRRSTADGTSLAAALLERADIGVEALGYQPGTVRLSVPSGSRRSGRPSLERGREILDRREAVGHGTELRRLIGTEWDPALALPRVWRAEADKSFELDAYFNPMIPEFARPSLRAPDLARTEEILRAHWYQKRSSGGSDSPSP